MKPHPLSAGEAVHEDPRRAEFFDPARPLIARAPWVFARGNHEDCQRGGYGWAYYFGDETAACDTTHKPAFIQTIRDIGYRFEAG